MRMPQSPCLRSALGSALRPRSWFIPRLCDDLQPMLTAIFEMLVCLQTQVPTLCAPASIQNLDRHLLSHGLRTISSAVQGKRGAIDLRIGLLMCFLLSRATFLNKLCLVQRGWLRPRPLARSLSFLSCSPAPPSSTSSTWCNVVGSNLVRLLARSLFLLSRAAFLNELCVVQRGWLKPGPLARSLSFPAQIGRASCRERV